MTEEEFTLLVSLLGVTKHKSRDWYTVGDCWEYGMYTIAGTGIDPSFITVYIPDEKRVPNYNVALDLITKYLEGKDNGK